MLNISDVICRAIQIRGATILKNKSELCIIIEDLSPDLHEQLEFIRRVYNDQVGRILYEAFAAKSSEEKNKYVRDADRFLDKENGRNSEWRERILSYFLYAIGACTDVNTKKECKQLDDNENDKKSAKIEDDINLKVEGSESLIENLLAISNNMRTGLESLSDDFMADSFFVGMEMFEKMLHQTLIDAMLKYGARK